MTQMEQEQALHPTVEITKGTGTRVTGWGWTCTCGDSFGPRLLRKDFVLQSARNHFDTKHGGDHGRK